MYSFKQTFTLTSQYKQSLEIEQDSFDLKILHTLNFSDNFIWQPFSQKLQNYTSIQLPEKLKDIRQMPLHHLVNELQNLSPVDKNQIEIPNWGISFGTFLLITLVIALLCLCWKRGYFQKLCSA